MINSYAPELLLS